METEPFIDPTPAVGSAGGSAAPHLDPDQVLTAVAEPSGGLDATIDAVFGPVANVLSAIVFFEIPVFGGIPVIVLWLMAAAIFITVYLRFQPIIGIKHSFRVIRGVATRKTDPGEVSSFQALATELSGTVGLGNIAGVAVAITVGGPGAALWIIIFGFFAMTVKMAEATLGVRYRQVAADGTTAGGPMYYLRDGLAEIGRPRTGRFLAVFYAIVTLVGVFGAGNLFQSNQSAAVLVNATGGEQSWLADKLWLIGLVMAVFCALVVLGGIKKIGEWTSAITPLMAILYFIGTVAVIAVNFTNVPSAIMLMFQGAFTGDGVTGGIIGVAVVGIQRALFSNAAGVGSAGMAHSASKTTDPATEGFTALWEPLVDSIIICTLTSLAIITTGLYDVETDGSNMAGVELTAQAFGTVTPWFPVLLTICVVLFGFSTILAYSYYGQKAIGYLSKENKVVEKVYQIAWVVAVVVGASISLDSVIAFSDAMFFLMSIPNLLGIYFLSRILRLEILRFRTKSVLRAHDEIPLDLQVGLRDHEPTKAQVKAEKERLERAKEKRRAIRREFRAAQRARAKKD